MQLQRSVNKVGNGNRNIQGRGISERNSSMAWSMYSPSEPYLRLVARQLLAIGYGWLENPPGRPPSKFGEWWKGRKRCWQPFLWRALKDIASSMLHVLRNLPMPQAGVWPMCLSHTTWFVGAVAFHVSAIDICSRVAAPPPQMTFGGDHKALQVSPFVQKVWGLQANALRGEITIQDPWLV